MQVEGSSLAIGRSEGDESAGRFQTALEHLLQIQAKPLEEHDAFTLRTGRRVRMRWSARSESSTKRR